MQSWRPPVWSDPYFAIRQRGDIVCVFRSSQAYPDLDTAAQSFGALLRELGAERHPGSRFLVDLREARGRNDAGFEQTIAPLRRRLWEGWGRAAILVETAIGAMQVRRHMAQDRVQAEVFHDLDEALRFLES